MLALFMPNHDRNKRMMKTEYHFQHFHNEVESINEGKIITFFLIATYILNEFLLSKFATEIGSG